MSRIGEQPITLPAGVTPAIDGSTVTVTGPKGELSQEIPAGIDVSLGDGLVSVTRRDDERETRSLHGLVRSLVNNMVVGVSTGFQKDLEIVGTGYRATAKGKGIELQLGFSHSITVDAPEGITFTLPRNTYIEIAGIDKQLVGQVAANIRALRSPEPYKGKGVRYANEHVKRKAGKAGK
ncbi:MULTISPECIES: 50S ribosomal protein L6 [Candidatus Microthrix]|jgi:large subunit ribosomal protein L6|uniref:Large ribosomal subunit protein uL6 n=1 Tax=Candidatus Neomicrothrix parvicella RN1 TaxID=1229780 RepID=R4Z5V7_9ACTN|nr:MULTISPECIES: 50S ribosomal protein L6 [Microthrix]NLH65714.1 50S ribosomal protein L6 [Candidatus Microthrix parvicella]MBK6503623.1 50S ribosomal protein L6 [Candidatus Microthrix sp.]MBK7020796.1 50S ribosomal protein L6 [Candidatus Microthrix sp.]MBK7323690.1 50S ribosomal protein L6 [Candidatus Microthrix sp.]MBL0204611.1 50S ribosomal protein L6 [Candidatus Microthrix sp.]